MSFQLLAAHLHATALAAKRHFATDYGAKSFREEAAIEEDLPLTPTLSAQLSNGGILCVEVSVKAYSNSLDTFVVECVQRCLPVKLYVVIPSAKGDLDFAANLKKAKGRGVGVVEIEDEGKAFVAADAVSLSLFGMRRNQINEFPKSKREAVRQAEQTFLNGNPVKGCQSLYEELEAVTRAFAKRSKAEGWWRTPHKGEKGPKQNLDTGAWASVLHELGSFIDLKACRKKCPLIGDGLIASARGVTDPRNSTSHKPKDLKTIVERDKKLRTLFEGTSDLLKGWYDATRPLKL